MKIYVPKTAEIRKKVVSDCDDKNFDGEENTKDELYTCESNEFIYFKSISTKEFDNLPICSTEHEMGNIILCNDGETFLLDGYGYCRVIFHPN